MPPKKVNAVAHKYLRKGAMKSALAASDHSEKKTNHDRTWGPILGNP